MLSESAIEKKIVAYARELGFLTFKFTSPSQRGVPDRIFISPAGHVLFLEIKAPGQKPTPLQLRMIQKLREQNVAAGWTDDMTEGRFMIHLFNREPRGWNDEIDF